MFRLIIFFVVGLPFIVHAQSPAASTTKSPSPAGVPGFQASVRILTNQVGYESSKSKRAVIEATNRLTLSAFQLINDSTGKVVYTGKPSFCGPVDKWKHLLFWTIDFSPYSTTGVYRIKVGASSSHPFSIGRNVLEKATLSDVVYYFKGQRSAGLIDKADHHLALPAAVPNAAASSSATSAATATNAAAPTAAHDTLDLHGGWYDATGDYGKHLSHLSFSSYFNPQQIPLVEYSLLKTNELLAARSGTDFRQIMRRITDEAMYGADYLCRVHAKGGSFYRSVAAPGAGKLPKDRAIGPENQSYRIKQSKDQSFGGDRVNNDWRSYQSSYRSGGGMAIAALAMAYTAGISGDYPTADYLKAAEEAFAFLERENPAMTNDGKENILDDYCALSAATELLKATRNPIYQQAAQRRANNLLNRFASWKTYKGYWRADDADRPFFHPSDAGLPLVSLVYYYPYASEGTRSAIKLAVRRSLEYELKITHEVANPFGYSRQLVQDTLGQRRSAFFFPHGSEASPWWQGEDARLGSMAAAARLAAPLFVDDKPFSDSLHNFALDQLNWILGLNPFDASMLQGTGLNNPGYGFFGTFEYTNAPGGIVNGITSGLDDEQDIDFNISYAATGKDYDWRWAEQWLPHTSWYLLAVAAGQPAGPTDEAHSDDHPILSIGAPAPDFSLPGIDGKTYTLSSFKDSKVLMVMFICNHCPTSQAYENRMIQLTRDYASKGVGVVAINPNHPSALRLDELGYSDLGDSFDEMKIRAKDAGYNFPYLYDGDSEIVSKQYGPVSTPHVFIFDRDRKLRYNGRIDDTEDPKKTPHAQDARNAIEALLADTEVPVAVTKVFGCSIKWAEKSNWTEKAAINWAKEPVSIDTIGYAGIARILKNDTRKLRLINVWATWCIPCVQEFSELVTLNRMYRDRGFQLVSISMDDASARKKALSFLEKKQSSSPNYIFTGEDKYKLIEAIDPKWQGALPYSLLVEPGGKIVYARQGTINPEELKKIIFDSPYMGRIYK
ncbi:MAG TPA: redoxin domain-containing protein [Puia sp.]|jgi:peroxiredoxin|nr:redoxin domain-containing protein [Puia sp.]